MSTRARFLAEVPGRLALGAAAFLAVVWSCQPLVHDDIFWHIRTGEWIARHGRVPLDDFFSFTRLGARWITHEWGFSVLAAAAYHLGGFRGVFALTALILLAIGWAVRRRCPLGDPAAWFAAAAALALSLLAVRSLVFLRPALVGELCFAVALLLVDRYRSTAGRSYLVALLAVYWLWANVHSGVIFGFFVLGLQAAESLLPEAWTGDRPPGRSYRRWMLPAATAGAILVSLLNPNGLDALRFPFLLNRVFFHSGIAWDLGQFKTYSPLANVPLALLTLLLLVGWLRARPQARPRPWEIVAIAVFFLLSLRASRFVFSLTILMVPAIARLWSRPNEAPDTRLGRVVSWTTAALAAGVVAVAVAVSPVRWPPRELDRSLPAGAARFLEKHSLRGHMFHHANHGGYLYFALGQPIFWDGRNDVFWTLTREVTTTPFPIIQDRYGIDILVLTEREYGDLRPLIENPAWGLVYWDDAAAVYLRRDRFAAVIPELELRWFRGFGGGTSELQALATDAPKSQAARAELRSLLATWPENQRALYFLGVLSHYAGDRAEAIDALRRAIDLGSNDLLERTLAVTEQAPR